MTLLDDIGGEAAVAAVVKLFTANLVGDSRIAPFFAKTNMARQRVSLTKFLVHVLGGKPYDGASMRHAHKGLGLTDVQFDVVLESLADALRTCGVCEAHIAQIAAVADSTRGDVLCRTPAAP